MPFNMCRSNQNWATNHVYYFRLLPPTYLGTAQYVRDNLQFLPRLSTHWAFVAFQGHTVDHDEYIVFYRQHFHRFRFKRVFETAQLMVGHAAGENVPPIEIWPHRSLGWEIRFRRNSDLGKKNVFLRIEWTDEVSPGLAKIGRFRLNRSLRYMQTRLR